MLKKYQGNVMQSTSSHKGVQSFFISFPTMNQFSKISSYTNSLQKNLKIIIIILT